MTPQWQHGSKKKKSNNEREEIEWKTKRRQLVNCQENDERISRQAGQKVVLFPSSATGRMSTTEDSHEVLQSKSLIFGKVLTRALEIPTYMVTILTYAFMLEVGGSRKVIRPNDVCKVNT